MKRLLLQGVATNNKEPEDSEVNDQENVVLERRRKPLDLEHQAAATKDAKSETASPGPDPSYSSSRDSRGTQSSILTQGQPRSPPGAVHQLPVCSFFQKLYRGYSPRNIDDFYLRLLHGRAWDLDEKDKTMSSIQRRASGCSFSHSVRSSTPKLFC